jgi:magnesium chelatase family protein
VTDLLAGRGGESTAAVAARVAAARDVAATRAVRTSAEIPPPLIDDVAPLTAGARRMLEFALRSNSLSARGLHRVRLVARTLADLAGDAGPVGEEPVALALQLRAEPAVLDRAVCA